MEFVDRTDETRRLTSALNMNKPSFVVVYGRRRLGKSTLIKRVISDNDIYYLADKSEKSHQIELLASVVTQKIPDFDKVCYPDWETLLRAINHRSTDKFTLCLDELPYLVDESPELPSVLQKLLDEKSLKYNILVCGSSQQMMYGIAMDSTSPLYGRADAIMKLAPLKLYFIKEALRIDSVQSIEEYAVWGGVPRYWELRANRNTLADSLWEDVFSVNGILYDEPSKLLQDDIKDTARASTIMSFIAAGANRMSEIASRCGMPATDLSRPLKKLLDLDLIEKETPYGTDEKNSKKSIYKIADPFLSFYYRFLVPNRSFVQLNRHLPISIMLNEHFGEYVSTHWEKMCRDCVTGNIIDGVVYGKAQRWWGSVLDDGKPTPIELDIVSESLDGKYLLVGECKWTTPENGQLLADTLMHKAQLLPFAKDHVIVPKLFLKNTPNDNISNVILPNEVIDLSI